MANSKNIAGLAGPVSIAVALSEALNLDVLASAPPYFVYLNGTLLFVAGLALVRAHNYWKLGWQLIVTLLGWGLVALGLLRMFVPELSSRTAHQNPKSVFASIAAVFLAGVIMTAKAYLSKNAD